MTLRATCVVTLISGWSDAWERLIDGRILKEVKVDYEKLEAVPEFCYLRNMLYAEGDCELAVVTRCKCDLGKFRQLLPFSPTAIYRFCTDVG